MRDPGTPTFDQLALFLAVVETGTLAAAGRRLGRATSVVSYGIDNLERLLGVALFERAATRRLRLTEAGHAVAAEARQLAHGIDGLRAKVRGLLGGLEAELPVVVDVMLPTDRLVAALTDFQAAFPTVTVRLYVEALGAVAELLGRSDAAIGVCGPLYGATEEMVSHSIGGVAMLPVAAPGHPLARPGVPAGAARQHLQLVLSDRSRLTEGQDFGVLALRSWRLADLGAKHALLRAGAGWGNMPEPMVRDDLATGRLVRLQLPEWPGVDYPLQVIHPAARPPGPAGRWLMARFAAG